jgi:alkyl hydroperoxide reductase subunit AhpC
MNDLTPNPDLREALLSDAIFEDLQGELSMIDQHEATIRDLVLSKPIPAIKAMLAETTKVMRDEDELVGLVAALAHYRLRKILRDESQRLRADQEPGR